MLVIFEFKDSSGKILPTNNTEREMTNEEILVLFNSKEIAYPVNLGILYTIKHCVIENSLYDMFSEPYKLRITLKEK